ncbi:sensor histidine kinase [Sphingobacterium spiritivorum]|nr:HAMP domain-containing sensor histidine kinase [Sphingobacterium spiritivorum]QQT34172.1 HAMP domain-containing histidine kinase [Sphingobacterium spiritivorum]WQD35008.1 HAMP domain-containing sensor histidine kinase [Sphingobacterium spiritivorum]SUI99030.1 Alkaline phosphatase synthesis sensor protein phoR [Sphingobacterium spiritivorum]
MSTSTKYTYRKNIGLLIAFVVFVTILYVVSVFFARTMISNFVDSEFANRKVEVYDKSLVPFNDFFQNRIPEISYYQGFLDTNEARGMIDNILRKYPFVRETMFYDIAITNDEEEGYQIKYNNLLIQSRSVFSYSLNENHHLISKRMEDNNLKNYSDDFNNMTVKLVSFLDRVNDSTKLTDNLIFKIFYDMTPGKIAYMNIPRIGDLVSYRELLRGAIKQPVTYDQDLFVFYIDPRKIKITNVYPNLYEHIEIVPLVSVNLTGEKPYLYTEVSLPGALSDYKITFSTSESFIKKETNRRFAPVVLGISLLYIILLLIAYLIYRNVMINSRLYRLQYDFINNLTHEFKTPVSVIKIAGNNIKSAEKISDEERTMYGKILDQEADKLNSLMNKLLSFTQIENKSIKFKRERVDLKELCETIFSATKISYPDLKLSYRITVKNDMITDPVLLSSVFQNLIDNAYKYSNPSNKVLDVDIQQNKKNFVIIFRDEGIGINKQEYQNIFKKFYRVKNQYNQQGSIGLGLAFCKEITEFMGGDIRVDSQLGKGTTFTLTFPV